MDISKKDKIKTRRLLFAAIASICGSVALYAAIIICLSWPISEFSITKSGAFGDSFGLLTSLFSGLAFSILIITVTLQREELALQRQELMLTREVLDDQKEEIKKQGRIFEAQTFNNLFFSMNSSRIESMKGLEIPRSQISWGAAPGYVYENILRNRFYAQFQQRIKLTSGKRRDLILEEELVSRLKNEFTSNSVCMSLSNIMAMFYSQILHVELSFPKNEEISGVWEGEVYIDILRQQFDLNLKRIAIYMLASGVNKQIKQKFLDYGFIDVADTSVFSTDAGILDFI